MCLALRQPPEIVGSHHSPGVMPVGRPQDHAALLEWLQAMGQCFLMFGRYSSALNCQRELVGMLDNTVPVDLRFYYLQTFVHIKLLAGEADDEAKELLGEMESLLDREDFPQAKRAYSRKSLLQLLGRWFGEQGRSLDAINTLCNAYQIQAPPREQAVTTALALYYQLKHGTDVPDWACDMLLFYAKHGGELQPTDRVQYWKYVDFVDTYFSEHRS